MIIIGLNDGIVMALAKDHQVLAIISTKLNNISAVVECNDGWFVVVDEVGCCARTRLTGEVEMRINNKKSRAKKILRLDKFWVLFYQNGDIHLYDS